MTIATAESCTAGSLATLLADTPGAGDSFQGAFVVYSKDSKIATLGVPSRLISAHSWLS
jgi:PncC family amidohydrolase